MPLFSTLFHSTLPDSAKLYNTVLLFTTRQCQTLQHHYTLHYQTVIPDMQNVGILGSRILFFVLLYTTKQYHTLQHCFTLLWQIVPHFKPLVYSTLPDSGTLYNTVLLYTSRQCNTTYSTLPDSDTLYNTVLLYTTKHYHTLQHCFTLHYQTVPYFTTLFYSTLPNSYTLYNTVLLYTSRQCNTTYFTLPDSAKPYNTVLIYTNR